MCKGPKTVVGGRGVGQVRVRVDSVDRNTIHALLRSAQYNEEGEATLTK